MKRLVREKETIEKMIKIYCDDHHAKKKKNYLCDDCYELYQYARRKIDRCHYGSHKPACRHCPVHCYQSMFRDDIRKVMKHSGRKMLFRYPFLTIMHLIDSMRYRQKP